MEQYKIIIVEDDLSINKSLTKHLEKKYKVISFTNSNDAFSKLHLHNPDLILLDMFLGYDNGLALLDQLRLEGWQMPVIIITGSNDIKLAVRSVKLGAEDFILKPIELEQLDLTIEKALRNSMMRRRIEITNEQLQKTIGTQTNIIGESESITSVLKLASKAAASNDTTVLLTGETGTGKELIANYIHNNSKRKDKPFIPINCGAIPKDLAENELFGHERGAFTGANDKVNGRFEQAQHGTIMLDEIAELSLDLQVKLLRILEARKFYRLGGQKEISIDVRVIAATNKNLAELVAKGEFREDLYYRLNTFPINIPPLRERGNDILLLAAYFIDEFNKERNSNINFDSDAINILLNYKWPGNIRELKNVIERILLLHDADKNTITKSELALSGIIDSNSINNNIKLTENNHYLKISNNGATESEVLTDLIIQTLTLTKGNIKKATKLLNTTETKLKYMITQYGINIETYKNL